MRQRTVFPTREVPHLWAHGRDARIGARIRNPQGNCYAENGILYSYGSHFPIAQRVKLPDGGAAYLFNNQGTSNTTNRHRGRAFRAAQGNGPIFDIDPSTERGARYTYDLWAPLANRKGSVKPVARWFQTRADEYAAKAAKPGIHAATRLGWISRARRVVEEWRTLHAAFRLRLSIDAVKEPKTIAMVEEKWAGAFETERTREARRDIEWAERDAKRQAANAERHRLALTLVDDWRRGDSMACIVDKKITIRNLNHPVMRIIRRDDGDHVETSWSAVVPIESARQALRLLPRLIARMNAPKGAGHEVLSIGQYSGAVAKPAGLKIGCHDIPWSEIRAFCAFYNWECPELPCDPAPVALVAGACI